MAAPSIIEGMQRARCRQCNRKAAMSPGRRGTPSTPTQLCDGLQRASHILHAEGQHGKGIKQTTSRRIILASPTIMWMSCQAWSAKAFDYLDVRPIDEGIELVANDFQMVVPPGFVDIGIPAVQKAGMSPGGPGAPPPVSPIKVRYASPSGKQLITVIVREASAIKPTFTQVKDISDWGDGSEVAKLVLPPATKVQAFRATSIERPPKDTRTVMGVVPQAPQNVYKYQFLAPNGQPVAMAAAAQKGRVYIMAMQADSADEDASRNVAIALDSFRCKDEFRPMY